MSQDKGNADPLNFFRSLWDNVGFSMPGMVAPTMDIEELDKRITDLKTVEGWLRMNLSMLQLTIQGLEMQRSTLSTVQTLNTQAGPAVDAATLGLSQAALWPWNMMNQMHQQMTQANAAQPTNTEPNDATPAAAKKGGSKKPAS